MRLEERIRALEARFISDPVILYFADGSTREICGAATTYCTDSVPQPPEKISVPGRLRNSI